MQSQQVAAPSAQPGTRLRSVPPPSTGPVGIPSEPGPSLCDPAPHQHHVPHSSRHLGKQWRSFLFHVTVREIFKNYESIVIPACCHPSEAFYTPTPGSYSPRLRGRSSPRAPSHQQITAGTAPGSQAGDSRRCAHPYQFWGRGERLDSPSRRDGGLLFLPDLESNPWSSLQTSQED